ncbi:hypothetical protein MKMG_01402 [Methanogenium sp. MK-MG]|nr:hypothetical protein MKMG_01402 [Methanogenium sp. MK-MG]
MNFFCVVGIGLQWLRCEDLSRAGFSLIPVFCHPVSTLFDPLCGGIGGQNGRIFSSFLLPENDGCNAFYLLKWRLIAKY